MAKRKAKPIEPPLRDARGRFLSARQRADLADALNGRLAVQVVKGREVFRATSGRIVRRDLVDLSAQEPARIIRKKGKPVKVAPQAIRAEASELRVKPKTLRKRLYGQSAPGLVDDNATTGRATYIKRGGKLVKVSREDAGKLSDALRVMLSDYVRAFAGLTASPQLQVGLVETAQGDVLDFDQVDTVDPDLAEEMAGEDEIQDAAQEFNERMNAVLDRVTVKPLKHAKEGRRAGKVRPGTRPGPRSGDRRKGRKG